MIDTLPNIVFVITDQQRLDTIQSLGYGHMDTPNLDRLVEEGVSFTNCHVSAPACGPSRASLFTGYYPHTTGILTNKNGWEHTWIDRLDENDYYTVNIGKMHTDPFDAEVGFNERYVVENKDRFLSNRYYFDEWDKALAARGVTKQQRELYRERDDYEERMGAFKWKKPPDLQSDMFVGNLTTWWLDTKPVRDRPLFLEVGFPGPHPPYDPISEYAEQYIDRDLPTPKLDDEDIENQPPPLRDLREHHAEIDHDSVVHSLEPTDEQLHRQRAYYYANVSMIDRQVGQLMEALERNGYSDNTIIIFSSDHGDALNDHGHIQKWTMYDEVTRVPLVVWDSESRFGDNRRVDKLCQWMDIGPTILELADVSVPDSMEAESLLPFLRDESRDGRQYVFAEQGQSEIFEGAKVMTMVRSNDWKLVHFVDESYGQLFDLRDDHQEMVNLWDDPAAAEAKDRLLAELRDWHVRSAARTQGWIDDLHG